MNTPTENPSTNDPGRRGRGPLLALGIVLAVLGSLLALDRALTYAYHPARGNPPDGVVILTTQWCGYCAALRQHLQANGIPYIERDTERSWAGYWGLYAVRARGVPVTAIGSEVILGFAPRIDATLVEAGYRLKTEPSLP
jgi:glutaredoxin